MLKIAALYLCLTIFLVAGIGNDSIPDVPKPMPPSENGTTPPEVKVPEIGPEPRPAPDNSTTTAKPNTTTTVTPSPQPNTTTKAPITTSTTTTTTTTTTSTTTTSTTTTTPAPVTSTVAPTPAPTPQVGQWIVNGTNETCIVVKMAVQFNITYLVSENETKWEELNLPTGENATVATGDCGAKEQTLNITWHNGSDSLMIHFVKNDTTDHYSMHRVVVSLAMHEFPNIKSNKTMELTHEIDQFKTKTSNSYRCMRLQTLDLMREGENGTVGWLKVSDLQFQAFKSDKATNFALAQDCSADVPDVVPIAVGCALTALVIIVLVAYLVGRRRSQARGYVSM